MESKQGSQGGPRERQWHNKDGPFGAVWSAVLSDSLTPCPLSFCPLLPPTPHPLKRKSPPFPEADQKK